MNDLDYDLELQRFSERALETAIAKHTAKIEVSYDEQRAQSERELQTTASRAFGLEAAKVFRRLRLAYRFKGTHRTIVRG